MHTSPWPRERIERFFQGYFYSPEIFYVSDVIEADPERGTLHAYFFHDCLWEDGWVGFGNRIESAEFKALAAIDRPLELRSTERKLRKGKSRVLIEFDFEFSQDEKPVYLSRQMATFLKRPVSTA